MSNTEKVVSIILYTIIQSDSLARVFKGDAANKPRLAELRGFRRSRRDSLGHKILYSSSNRYGSDTNEYLAFSRLKSCHVNRTIFNKVSLGPFLSGRRNR